MRVETQTLLSTAYVLMEDEKPEDVGFLLRMIILNSNKQEPSRCYAYLPHDWGSANPRSITMGPEGGVRLLHRD